MVTFAPFSAWALSVPELEAALIGSSARAAFSALQRPWRWAGAGPTLSKSARAALGDPAFALPELARAEASSDGSTKLLLGFGEDRVEAVHMPRPLIGKERTTICISSQVGCAMGCGFCATATMGFRRQLSAGEIVAQVQAVVSAHGPRHPSDLTLVFMGMGEPLHNLAGVAKAIATLCDAEGLGLSPRRITVSTSGLVPEIAELGELASRPLLAVSLNATTDDVRSSIMPIGRRYPLAQLRAALECYPLRPRERITLEYVLLAGVNDSAEDAARLADFAASFPHLVNLIPYNAHPHAPFRAPSDAELDRFAQAILARRKTLVTVRRSRGRDVQGACGQLVQASALGRGRRVNGATRARVTPSAE